MKKCKYCFEEIDKRATICPHCRRKQKSSSLITFIITLFFTLLIGFTILGVFLFCVKSEVINIDSSLKFENLFTKIGEKKLTCSKEAIDESGFKTTESVEVLYKKDKILKASSVSIVETEEIFTDLAINMGQSLATKFNKIDGFNVTYEKLDANKYQSIYEIDYNKLNYEQVADIFGEENVDLNAYRKDITIDEYKKEQLDGYTCK